MRARSVAPFLSLLSGLLLLGVATARPSLAEESAGAEQTGVLSGRVLNGEGDPVAGADVELYRYGW